MENVDTELLSVAARWVEQGHRVMLATVVKTWGSSPRPEGSMLIIRDDGRPMGSVSGGCVEDDLIDRICREGIDPTASPEVVEYGVSADEAHRFGLPCGGTLRLVLEPLNERSELSALAGTVTAVGLAVRTLDLASGRAVVRAGSAHDSLMFNGRTLRTVHGPRYRMLLIGAGDLSRHVAATAVGLGYDVVVCDPREAYSEDWEIPGVRLVRTMPDDTVLEMSLDARCAVIALTHDPKLDDLALMEALRTEAFYVGAIGSRRNNAARRERLRLFDLDEREIGRLRGPVGLYIGSRTPAEIALSILAEVTACKNNVPVHGAIDVTAGKQMHEEVIFSSVVERFPTPGRVLLPEQEAVAESATGAD